MGNNWKTADTRQLTEDQQCDWNVKFLAEMVGDCVDDPTRSLEATIADAEQLLRILRRKWAIVRTARPQQAA